MCSDISEEKIWKIKSLSFWAADFICNINNIFNIAIYIIVLNKTTNGAFSKREY